MVLRRWSSVCRDFRTRWEWRKVSAVDGQIKPLRKERL
jgi:hypothetical protein